MTRQQLREKIDSELTDLTGGITSMELDLIMHLIDEYVAGVIGEDEPNDGFTEDETIHESAQVKYHREIRNFLRYEQRRRAGIGENDA